MYVLSLIHEKTGPASGVFAEVAEACGHDFQEWSMAWRTPPPRPIDEYGAVIILGGSMHIDQEHYHPWLREETLLLQRLLDQHVPVLGVCLGGQLLARAAHAPVRRLPVPEIGWYEIELTPAARDDPLLGGFPERFDSYQWHSYAFELPAGAVALGSTADCLQAFRLGPVAWGLQFHAEVTREILGEWIAHYETDENAVRIGFDPERALAKVERRIDGWNELNRDLAARFLDVAEGPQPAGRSRTRLRAG